MKKIFMAVVLSIYTYAGGFSEDALMGKWLFKHYAESDTPQQTHKIGYIMEFKPNGDVVTYMPKEDLVEHYEVKPNMIIYKGKRGDQKWKIISFDVEKGFVVNYKLTEMSTLGTLMTFEKVEDK